MSENNYDEVNNSENDDNYDFCICYEDIINSDEDDNISFITINCLHACDNYCRYNICEEDNDNVYTINITENPNYQNGVCQHSNTEMHSAIHLSSYNLEQPNTISGPLLKNDEIVITDKQFCIIINFPLRNHIFVDINNSNNEGLTLGKLLETIRSIYTYIYQKEEETASEIEYTTMMPCEICSNEKEYIDEHINVNICCMEKECCICTNKIREGYKLECGHIFHNECIKKWIKISNTCPTCRKEILICPNCNNNKYTEIKYKTKIIPFEHRNELMLRNETDGNFGIYDYDLEDLYLRSMIYYKREKQLRLNIEV